MRKIPLSVPNLSKDILPYVEECIETGWVSTGGRFITEFDQKVASFVKMNDAVSIQSGSAGLHVSMRLLGVEPNTEVIVPTVSFIATVNPIKYLNAYPVFMDCDDTLNMDLDKLDTFLAEECVRENGKLINKHTSREIKLITVVHVFGNGINMERVMEISEKYQVPVLEDAAESLGTYYTAGKYAGQYTGTIGHMGVYSYNANKIITSGGGGTVVSPNQALLDKTRYLITQAKNDELYFVHDEVGFNYRMTNITAAFGISQIDKLAGFIDTKQQNYERYKQELADVPGVTVVPFDDGQRPNYWFYSILIDEQQYGMNRDQLLRKLVAEGIQTRPLWGLLHQQKPYQADYAYRIEKAYKYADTLLNIPCSTNLSEDDLLYVCDKIKQFQVNA